jgi:hypothetical protein
MSQLRWLNYPTRLRSGSNIHQIPKTEVIIAAAIVRARLAIGREAADWPLMATGLGLNCRTRCTSRFRVVRPRRVTLRASRSAKTGARAPWFSARSRRRRGRGGRSGRRRVIAVKLPSQRFKSNEMPIAPDRMPDTQLAGFRTIRWSNRLDFAPFGASRNRAGTPGRCRRSKRARPAPPRPPLVRSDAGRRILTGDGEGALVGMRVGAVLHPSGCIHCYGVIAGSRSA